MERPRLAEDKSQEGIKSKARREKFIRELDLTKPERYVLNRYLNAKGRLSVKQVADEVSNYYGLPEGTAKGSYQKNARACLHGKAQEETGKRTAAKESPRLKARRIPFLRPSVKPSFCSPQHMDFC
jgi:hypothetical protein